MNYPNGYNPVVRLLIGQVLLFLPGLLQSAENPFMGCWDITPAVAGRPRGWWLKIEDAGGGRLRGWFNSAYDGKVNPIDEISVSGDEITFALLPKRPDGSTRRLEHRARVVKGTLQGSYRAGGGTPVTWTGVPAPKIDERDDGSWRKQAPVPLFNGRDLAGWRNLDPGRNCCWSAKDGILATAGKGSDLVSEAAFWNFELRIQLKLAPGSNSGVGLRGRYEVQLKDDAGDAPLINGTGGIYSRIVPEVNAGKGAGQWQDLRVRLVGRQVTVVLNGRTVIRKKDIEGLTAMAIDANEARPGPITLQGDHGAAEFRGITITPLSRQSSTR